MRIMLFGYCMFIFLTESGAVITDAFSGNDNETTSGNIITLGTPDVVAGSGNTIPPPPYGSSSSQQTVVQVPNYII